ncbi:MAG: hypothetical protein Greene041662_116 [Candidatus Peregrinibacteria bacterium Greene0416_62]|nr:MAG: hypothetical protein Greene041662_116 [Candidatus Peregrinibacteria bacterium Greene0416_62]TSC99266.1 MAG: hypothetical protein Greene101449_678 [Candidatus Peregrinibacteria bacterium Greene1014_49]
MQNIEILIPMPSPERKATRSIAALYSVEQALQRGMTGAIERIETQPIDAIFHGVRAGIIGMPIQQYTESIGITSSRIALESHRKGSPPSVGIMKDPNRFRILDDWQQRAEEEMDPVRKQILLDARIAVATLFTQKDEGAGTSWGYLRTMRLLAGRVNYETNAPVSKQTISKRQDENRLGNFTDILDTAQAIGLTEIGIPTKDLWNDPTIARGRWEYYRHATERKDLDPCATALHMMLIAAGYESDMLSLERDWGMPRSVARLLASKQRVPFTAVHGILHTLVKTQKADPLSVMHLRSVWSEGEGYPQKTFGEIMHKGLKKNRVTLPDLNRYLRITEDAPQRRSATSCALDRGDFYHMAPFIAFPAFALNAPEEIRDAITLKRAEILSTLGRRNPNMRKHIIAERRLCGVLESETKYDQKRYRRFELGDGKTRLREADVVKHIRSIGIEKVRLAISRCFAEKSGIANSDNDEPLDFLLRWILQKHGKNRVKMPKDIAGFVLGPIPTAPEKKDPAPPAMIPLIEPSVADIMQRIHKVWESKECKERREIGSVRDLCTQIIAKTRGGADSAHSRMDWDRNFSRKVRISPMTMRQIAAGRLPRHFPTLPVLKHVAESHDCAVTDAMRDDWAAHYATYLKKRGFSPVRRVLCTMIGEVASSQSEFCRNLPDFNDIALSQILRKLDRGEPCEMHELRPILIEAGATTAPQRMALVRFMLDAHNTGLKGKAIIHSALDRWRKLAKSRHWRETAKNLPGIAQDKLYSRPLPRKKRCQ